MSKKIFLDGEWDLDFTLPSGKRVSTVAEVPGNIEDTLMKIGEIEEYMPPDYEFTTARYELIDDLKYTTVFEPAELPPRHRRYINFLGIDTVGEIYLNGELIEKTMDIHLKYTVDVTDKLLAGKNELTVVIRSAELFAREHCHDMAARPHTLSGYMDSRTYLRKPRHAWGWDNAPRLLSAGIVRSVYIEDVPVEHFSEVYAYTDFIDDTYAAIGVTWIYSTDKKYILDHKIKVSLIDGDEEIASTVSNIRFIEGTERLLIPKDKVKLWWPSGFGEPKLYTLRVEMLEEDRVCASYEFRFGIRTLKLLRTENIEADGSGEFCFVINGERVFIRGTNWKPLHPLVSVSDKKLKEGAALREISDLGCNMVRIWGGGVYEDEALFDYCDRCGIMVWQDFMFACEIPPTDPWFLELVKREAEYVIKKYRNHPSLALWCGDNENDEAMSWLSYNSELRPSHSVVTRRVLKDAVYHNDPYRCYVESSPYASDENYVERRGEMKHFQPEAHLYPKTLVFSEELRRLKSKFIGETGPIDINAISPNAGMFERERERLLRLWDECVPQTVASHQSDGYFSSWRQAGKELCAHFFARDFTPDEFSDYTLAINFLSAEIFKDVIEYCRAERWEKTGVIWWSLMDMWPMLFNYSVIDADGVRKLPYHWIKTSQREVLLAAVKKSADGDPSLFGLNDTLGDVTVKYTVTAYAVSGEKRMILDGESRIPKNSSLKLAELPSETEPTLYIIKWERDGVTYANHVVMGTPSFDVMKAWVGIIGKECGFLSEIRELQ